MARSKYAGKIAVQWKKREGWAGVSSKTYMSKADAIRDAIRTKRNTPSIIGYRLRRR